MRSTTVGVVRETAPGERRVALVPDAVARLRDSGVAVLVESGAGAAANFADCAYARAGAMVCATPDVYRRADVVACVSAPGRPGPRSGQAILGLLQPFAQPDLIRYWAARGVTAISLDQLPRTLSRARPMDALTSQANITGYKAVLVAANAYDGFLPMLTTATGTATGTVALSRADATVVVGDGVTIIGAGSLPSQVPAAASTAYSHNVSAALRYLLRDGVLAIDTGDELQSAMVLCHAGALRGPEATRAARMHNPGYR
jgi:NAD(P) transhydrogenase subunit alpha